MEASRLIDEGARALRRQKVHFSRVGDEREQAIELLEHVLGRRPKDRENVPTRAQTTFERLVARRATGEPLPYIVGWTEFRGLRMGIKPGAFIPRATSEFLAQQAITRARRRAHPIVLDLATGIGPVALAVASEVPKAQVYAVDVSAEPVKQGRANARALGLGNVTFSVGDLFAPLPKKLRGTIDVLTIHPPYVARHEISELPSELRRFEPYESLTDRSKDGMGIVRRVTEEGFEWLRPGGWMLMEVGAYMARTVRSALTHAGYREVRSTQGEFPYTRVLVGRA